MTAGVGRRGRWLLPPLVVAYLVAALWPFQLDLPSRHRNGFERSGQLLRFDGSSLATTPDAEPWTREVANEGSFSLHLSVRSLDPTQHGPARIFTASRDEYERDLTIAQDDDDLVVRLRRPGADRNGQPDLVVRDLFAETSWLDIDITADEAVARIEIDGDVRLLLPLGTGAFDDWEMFPVTLGNERTGTRGWRGEIRAAELRSSSGSVDYLGAPLDVPETYWTLPTLSIATRSDPEDMALNLIGFLPLGALLGAIARRHAVLWASVGALLVSLAMEIGQVFTVSRDTSIIDLAFNTLGGAMGGALSLLRPRAGGRRTRGSGSPRQRQGPRTRRGSSR